MNHDFDRPTIDSPPPNGLDRRVSFGEMLVCAAILSGFLWGLILGAGYLIWSAF